MFATIAQALSIWLAAATVAALSVGAVLGGLPATPAPVPDLEWRPRDKRAKPRTATLVAGLAGDA